MAREEATPLHELPIYSWYSNEEINSDETVKKIAGHSKR